MNSRVQQRDKLVQEVVFTDIKKKTAKRGVSSSN